MCDAGYLLTVTDPAGFELESPQLGSGEAELVFVLNQDV